jgi:putative hemolysin
VADIVESLRLRAELDAPVRELCNDAANTIERLQALIDAYAAAVARFCGPEADLDGLFAAERPLLAAATPKEDDRD